MGEIKGWTVISSIETGLMCHVGNYDDFNIAMGKAMKELHDEMTFYAANEEDRMDAYRITPLYHLEGDMNLAMDLECKGPDDKWDVFETIWFIPYEK